MVRPSRATSSVPPVSGTRRLRSAAEIASTSARIASAGASVRPTTSQVVVPTTASSAGRPAASSAVTMPLDRPTGSTERATSTV